MYPDPTCVHEFALRVIAVMSTRFFSSLITKCHQQEQTAGQNKLCNNSPRRRCVSCVFVCFAACLCQTRELHPVLIKAGCSFYIITECDACLQQISPIISVCYTRHPAPGTLATHAFLPIALLPLCNLLHLFLLLPFHPHSHLQFPHPLTPSFTPSDVLIPVPLISAVLHDFLIKCFCFLLFLFF